MHWTVPLVFCPRALRENRDPMSATMSACWNCCRRATTVLPTTTASLVLLRFEHDPQPIIAEGEWHGQILREQRGGGGFGYDPLFLDPQLGKTGAELTLEQKNRVSHRGKALAILIERLGAPSQSSA